MHQGIPDLQGRDAGDIQLTGATTDSGGGMTKGNPPGALCGRPVKEINDVWVCTNSGTQDPPTVPFSLSEIQDACEAAVQAIAVRHTNRQAGWLAYMLEDLDEHNDTMADYVPEDLKDAIDTRLEMGRW
jgi:hypothetical protein